MGSDVLRFSRRERIPTPVLEVAREVAYLCDAYFVDLGQPTIHVVGQTRYWFGLFSHKRSTLQWKGMLGVPLGTLADDANTAKILSLGATP